jgi:hypothetical protein
MFKQFQWDEGGRQKKCFFFFFCYSHEGINGCFSLKTFFLSSKGRRRRSTDIPFRNNRENRREKKRATPLTQEGGPISIKLFPTHNTPTPSIKRGKKRNRTPKFFPIFQISKDLGTIFRGKFVWKKSLALAKCPGESERWVLSRGHFQVCMQLNPTSSLIWRVAMIAINRVLQKQKQAPKHTRNRTKIQ